MATIGIDVGKRQHIAAIHHDGEREARKAILRFGADRQGLTDLSSWLGRQGEISRAVLESSGHYHLNLAAALQRSGVPVALINPLESKYFGKRRLQRTKSDPADARTLATLAMVDEPQVRDVLAGAELREAARFAMHLVDELGRVDQRICRLIEIGFPELEVAYHDPTCVSALAVLRTTPTAQAAARTRSTTLARASRPGGGRRIGPRKAEQISALAKDTIAAPELADQIGFQMRLLIAQHDLLESQIAEAEAHLATLLDGELVRRLRTIPGSGTGDRGHTHRRDRRHPALQRVRQARGVHRRAPGGEELGRKRQEPGDQLAHVQGRQRLPAHRAVPHGRRRHPAQPGDPCALRAQARPGQVEDERGRTLHEEVARDRLGRVAERHGLRRSAHDALTIPYGT